MRNIGIVCEFNPLHNGHKRILDYARELGAERVVCVMSGNATQRGELAVLDKYTRAKSAIASGADLVLELPYPWSSASAEYFARAAVSVLSGFCDTLLFGSECGDIDLICRAATLASSEEFREEYRRRKQPRNGRQRDGPSGKNASGVENGQRQRRQNSPDGNATGRNAFVHLQPLQHMLAMQRAEQISQPSQSLL